jgi:HD-GYP domain-containing protein (c-di-GMP phosphodiesterase class II)
VVGLFGKAGGWRTESRDVFDSGETLVGTRRLRTRRALVFATVLVQSAIVTVGGLWLASAVREARVRPVADHLAAHDAITATQFDLLTGGSDWPAIAWTLTVGVILIGGLTILAGLALIRRYESRLERINRGLEMEVQRRITHSLDVRNALIFGLAKLADYRDTDTGRHLERIAAFSELLATELRTAHPWIDRRWIERLRLASSLHDIGKVGIPDSILLKPGAFTPEERAIMQQHSIIGADTLLCIRERLGPDEFIDMGIEVALQHHERWDGTGYPGGLRGEEIALSARIVALADFYDALTSARVYKAARSHEETRQMILAERGRHFDPDVVDAFERVHERFDVIRRMLTGPDADARPLVQEMLTQARRSRAA